MTSLGCQIIDEIDRKIIGLLFEDSRKNFSDIGEEVKLSKNAIWTRFNRMCDQGIITGATVQINYKKLGYDAVAQLMLAVDPSKIEHIKNYIKEKIPEVFGPYVSASRFNLRAIVTLKKLSELGNLKEDLRRKLAIKEIQSMLWTDVWFLPQNLTLLPIKPQTKLKKTLDTETIICADELDLQLIKHLTVDSRVSFRDIAGKLQVSTETVARRYKRLKEEGVIVPRIQVAPQKIGYTGVLNYFLRFSQEQNIENTIDKIIVIPDTFYVMKCTGDFQIGVIIAIREVNQVVETGARVSSLDGLISIETSINPFLEQRWPIARTYTSTI